jgi:putative ABC transport system ATP-binding protein
MTSMTAMSLRSVSKTFGGATTIVDAVIDATFDIASGSHTAIVGASGSGKSTLLSLLGLMAAPSGGTYELFGDDVSCLSDDELAGVRASRIGFLFQSFALMEHLSVLENVAMAGLYQGVAPEDRRDRARKALSRVSLSGRIDATCSTLSGGEKQRVALARAL